MGYTRYWTRTEKPISEEFVSEVKKIIASSEKQGIHICDSYGTDLPIVSLECIYLNGNAEINADHESFIVTNKSGKDFCKTNRKPYDYAVRQILAVGEKLGIFTDVSSDKPEETIIKTDNSFVSEEKSWDEFFNQISKKNNS